MGMVMLLGTIIVITLMGSLESGVKPSLKDYFTERRHLVLYDGFLVRLFATRKLIPQPVDKC